MLSIKSLPLILTLVQFFLSPSHLVSCNLVDEVREDVIEKIDTVWKQLDKVDKTNKTPDNLFKLLGKYLKAVPKSISKVEKELSEYDYETALVQLSKVSSISHAWKAKWSEISVFTSPVDVIYNNYYKVFVDTSDSGLGYDFLDFKTQDVSDLILNSVYTSTDERKSISLTSLLTHAHKNVISSYNYEERDSFELLAQELNKLKSTAHFCLWNGKSAQRVIYGFYVSLLAIDIKEYAVLNFGYMLRYIENGTTFTKEVKEAKENLRRKAYEKFAGAKNGMSKASSVIWACDPSSYVEGTNYESFKELLQGIIENEKEMNPKGSCKQTCDDYTFTPSKCIDESCVRRRKCRGNLIECEFVKSDSTVCPAEAPRRFSYIDYKRGPLYGKKESCDQDTEIRDSFWRFWYHCSNCLCLCDDSNSPSTVRHYSTAPVVSDVRSNKIVTGVKLLLLNGILQFQIEQGVPTKKGYIQSETIEWKPTETLTKSMKSVSELHYFHRGLNLDDILLNSSYVVTGVRFNSIGEHFGLMVQATQMNPITAELLPSTSHWVSNDNTPYSYKNPRQEVKLTEVDIPTLAPSPSVPLSAHDEFLLFGPTSRVKDVAQTTVPFIDSQKVVSNPSNWLRGVGIYYKGTSGYGGFIAPKIFTVDVGSFMEDELK